MTIRERLNHLQLRRRAMANAGIKLIGKIYLLADWESGRLYYSPQSPERVSGRWSGFVLVLGLSLLMQNRAWSAAQFGRGLSRFVEENVRFDGFIENTTGLVIGHGSRYFDTANPFVMNRFTFQPEFNIDFREEIRLFLAWRFVKEPVYQMERRSRHHSVQPARNGTPLPPTYYDEYRPVPWEAVLDYKPRDDWNLRWGRQFISWGETDGFRLLDLINPQDTTFAPPGAPNLFNLDESRIPSWGLRSLYTVRPESNTIFEFFALPGALDQDRQRVDEFMGTNDTSDRAVKFGRWSSRPDSRVGIDRLFTNPLGVAPVVIPEIRRELPRSNDSWKIGARLTRNFGKLNTGLGYIWGYNPQAADMVLKLTESPSLCGPPACPPGATGLKLKLVNDRTNIFAGHFNYPVTDILRIPLNTTIRGELVFMPDKPFNISSYPGRNCITGAVTGLLAGPSCKHPSGIVEKNTVRYALGFDRTTLIPFLHRDDPWRAFNLSFQVFQSIILNHEKGIRVTTGAARIKPVSTILTFRASTGYSGDTILPDVFVAVDPEGYYVVNPAVSYVPPSSEKIRISLIGTIYGGRDKFKSFGAFSEKDSVFLKLRYQF